MSKLTAEFRAPPDPAARRRWCRGGLLALLPVLTVVAYLPALRGGFVWDDDDYVTQNLTLRTAEGLRDIWLAPRASPQYYPLVFTTFWLEYHAWGLHPLGYHLVNVLLHAGNALLLYLVLRKLGLPGAAVAAAVFAVHPVHVESVAWVTERKNVLSAFFYLAAFLAYLHHWPLESQRPRRWGWYAASLLLFVAALLSKTVACTLPAVLLIVAWWKRGRVTWRDAAALAPMLGIGLAAGLMTARLETSHVGAAGAEWSLSPAGRVVLAGRVALWYVVKDLWPHPLIFFYPRWHVDPSRLVQWLYPAGVVAVATVLFLARRRIGRAPLAALAIYLVTLVPAMGFFNVYPMRYSYVADHFQYLASVPVIAVTVAALARLGRRAGADGPFVTAPLVAALLAVLSVLAFRQARAYADIETLWRHTAARNPGAWAAWNNLGLALANRGEHDAAIAHFRRALEIKPDHADAILNIGVSHEAMGRQSEADAAFADVLRLRPNDAGVSVNLSTRYGKLGDRALAEFHARRALGADPDNVAARLNLASAVAGQGRRDEAIAVLVEARRIDPWSTPVRALLAVQLFNAGRRDEALAEARAAARRDPESQLARQVLTTLESAAAGRPAGP